MIQFILMLLGLAFPNNNSSAITTHNNPAIVNVQPQGGVLEPGDSTEDTGGETGPVLPPKK